MAYQPAENLTNRTFVGLIVAQFLPASTIRRFTRRRCSMRCTPDSLAVECHLADADLVLRAGHFCTLCRVLCGPLLQDANPGALESLEVVISLILLTGFYFGSMAGEPKLGGWIVMSCVFLMGTHAAFRPRQVRGHAGDSEAAHPLARQRHSRDDHVPRQHSRHRRRRLPFERFRHNEIWIGVILLRLSVIGTFASFLIAWLPPAAQSEPFPSIWSSRWLKISR